MSLNAGLMILFDRREMCHCANCNFKIVCRSNKKNIAYAKNFQFYLEFEIRSTTVFHKRSVSDNKTGNGKKRKQSEENTETVGDSEGDFSLPRIEFVDRLSFN